jgi:hypothetical protein
MSRTVKSKIEARLKTPCHSMVNSIINDQSINTPIKVRLFISHRYKVQMNFKILTNKYAHLSGKAMIF